MRTRTASLLTSASCVVVLLLASVVIQESMPHGPIVLTLAWLLCGSTIAAVTSFRFARQARTARGEMRANATMASMIFGLPVVLTVGVLGFAAAIR